MAEEVKLNQYARFIPSEEMSKKLEELADIGNPMPRSGVAISLIVRNSLCRIAYSLSVEFEEGGSTPYYHKVCSVLDRETLLKLLEYTAMAYPKAIAKKLLERL